MACGEVYLWAHQKDLNVSPYFLHYEVLYNTPLTWYMQLPLPLAKCQL